MRVTVEGRDTFASTGGRPFDPSRPTVVLMHGAGMDHSVWALQSRSFAHRGRSVLALDLPGHGRTAGPVLPTVAAMADWVAAALVAVGAGPAFVAGHSMGSLVALDLGLRHPDRVDRLALVSTGAAMPVTPALLEAAAANDHAAIDMVALWGLGTGPTMGGSPVPGSWMLGGTLRLLERAAPGVLHNDLAACSAMGDVTSRAATLACPVTIINGSRDAMTPDRGARQLAATIPGARFIRLDGVGHMPMVEAPDALTDALVAAL